MWAKQIQYNYEVKSMRCPYCKAILPENAKYCGECGAVMSPQEKTVATANAAGSAGLLLGRAARQARLNAAYDENEIVSDRVYNSILIGVLLWGLLVNVLLVLYASDLIVNVDPRAFLIGYFVCALAGIYIAGKSKKPLISFLGYNLVVLPFGLMIAVFIRAYGGIGARVVKDAFLYTFMISLGMLGLVLTVPQLFAKLGGVLLGVLGGLVLCELALLLFRIRQDVTDWIAAGLFSLYIGYDIYRAQQFPKTVDNAVDSALDIYMDIANLFIRILSLMGKKKK